MNVPLTILLLALIITLLAYRRRPSVMLAVLVVIEITGAGVMLFRHFRARDVTKPFVSVFSSGGYGLGRLLVESGRAPGKILLLLPGEGQVDTWRREGFETALEGSGFTVDQTATLPVELQTGCFNKEAFEKEMSSHPGLPYVAAFAGLPGTPTQATEPLFVVFHPLGTGGMDAWWKSGRLLGVIAPRMGDAPTPQGGEKLAGLADSFFNVRHSVEANKP